MQRSRSSSTSCAGRFRPSVCSTRATLSAWVHRRSLVLISRSSPSTRRWASGTSGSCRPTRTRWTFSGRYRSRCVIESGLSEPVSLCTSSSTRTTCSTRCPRPAESASTIGGQPTLDECSSVRARVAASPRSASATASTTWAHSRAGSESCSSIVTQALGVRLFWSSQSETSQDLPKPDGAVTSVTGASRMPSRRPDRRSRRMARPGILGRRVLAGMTTKPVGFMGSLSRWARPNLAARVRGGLFTRFGCARWPRPPTT